MNSTEAMARRWREEGRIFTADVNEYVHQTMVLRRDGVDEPPQDKRGDLAEKVLEHVRQANERGSIDDVRQRFPPAWEPFVEILQENGQDINQVAILGDGRIVLRVGEHYREGTVYIINDLDVEHVENVIGFGQSPDRKFFALAKQSGVEVYEQWDNRPTVSIRWPTGLEGIPAGTITKPLDGAPPITQLIPFPDGVRVLLVSSEGIFVLGNDRTVRLYPRAEDYRGHFKWWQSAYPDKAARPLEIDMEHGAISPGGKLIALGCQDSDHLIFNDNYELVGDVEPVFSYPHYTVFSKDGTFLACNECHFWNGMTIGVPMSLLPGLRMGKMMDNRLVELDSDARVYAATSRQDEFILGDAYGYLRAVDKAGDLRWVHFVGSTIFGMDLSRDEKTLVVGTSAGILSIIRLDTGTKDPDTIGTATHQEIRRWLFWKKEKKPLAW